MLRWAVPVALLFIIGRRLAELGWREIWIARPGAIGRGKDSEMEPTSTICPAPRRAMASATTLAPVTGATKFTSAIACAVWGASAKAPGGTVPPSPALKIAIVIGIAASAAASRAANPAASRRSKA